MNYLNSRLVLYLIVILLILFILSRITANLKIRSINNRKGVRFYYKFLGNIQWIKEQILTGKYLELKYLNPVEDKKEANIIILLEKKSENDNIVSIYSDKDKSIILTNLKLNDQKAKKFIEFLPITTAEDNLANNQETNDSGRE